VGRRNGRLYYWVCIPPRKIRHQFQGYKHTLLGFLGGKSSECLHRPGPMGQGLLCVFGDWMLCVHTYSAKFATRKQRPSNTKNHSFE